jgi:hypothetical protein
MSRFAFWMLNLSGMYLLMSRDLDDPSPTRVWVGGALVAVGTIGILARLAMLFRQRSQTQYVEADDLDEAGQPPDETKQD